MVPDPETVEQKATVEQEPEIRELVVQPQPEGYVEPSAWPQLVGSAQPNFGGAIVCACAVSWDAMGCLHARLVFEGPDGERSTVDVGPLPVAHLASLGAYAMAEAYSQFVAYAQAVYGMTFASGAAGNAPFPALPPASIASGLPE